MNRTLLLVAGGAAVVWYATASAFGKDVATPKAPAQPAKATDTSPGGTVTTPATVTAPYPGGNVVTDPVGTTDTLAGMIALAKIDGGDNATPDAWGYYLHVVRPDRVAPDPLLVWPGLDRTKPMSGVTYWNGINAYLSPNPSEIVATGPTSKPPIHLHGLGGWYA